MYGHWVRDMGFFEQGLTKMDPLFWETTAKLRVFSLARSLSLSHNTLGILWWVERNET